jgi:hypothetical protein
MKVACIGNMNNMMFTLCKYLKDENVDVTLFLFDDEPFLPSHDSNNDKIIPVKSLNTGFSTLIEVKRKGELFKELSKYDFFIGTDIAPALMAKLGMQLDIYVPHGSDIYSFPFVNLKDGNANNVWWLKEKFFVGKLQSIGVENARNIILPFEYDIHIPFKNKLKCNGEFINMTIPMVYNHIDSVTIDLEVSEKVKALFVSIRKENDLIVFSHSRQNGINFPGHLHVHNKGNDVLIKGFALFVKSNRTVKAKLILFEYGIDIKYAKRLIEELDIVEQVIWMPKMKRKDIMYCILNSDVCCGQFKNSWLTCGVVNEVLALGKPLLHYRDDNMYSEYYDNLYPILNAKNPTEINKRLDDFIEGSEVPFSKGELWLEEYTVKKPIQFILDQITSSNEFVKKSNSLIEKLKIMFIIFHTNLLIFKIKVFLKLR